MSGRDSFGAMGSLHALAAAAVLASASAVSPADEVQVAKARVRREEDREECRRRIQARKDAWAAASREKERRAREIVDTINAGIDPTNGRLLSRQQRRNIARKGYYA